MIYEGLGYVSTNPQQASQGASLEETQDNILTTNKCKNEFRSVKGRDEINFSYLGTLWPFSARSRRKDLSLVSKLECGEGLWNWWIFLL
jgi:hypothetical protein